MTDKQIFWAALGLGVAGGSIAFFLWWIAAMPSTRTHKVTALPKSCTAGERVILTGNAERYECQGVWVRK